MLTRENNEIVCRVSRGTPMGDLMRQYWIPALPSTEFPEPDCPPRRMMLLGENLVMFRDSLGRVGALAEACPHRGASLYFGRNEECGLRCAYHGWKFDIHGNCLDLPSEEGIKREQFQANLRRAPTPAARSTTWCGSTSARANRHPRCRRSRCSPCRPSTSRIPMS